MTHKHNNPPKLHPKNRHLRGYDFEALCLAEPALSAHVITSRNDQSSIDFADPQAVKTLNLALLKKDYRIDFWDIPAGYLCPPIPGRVDYIHYLADLLSDTNQGSQPQGARVSVLDIGTGASCIYPILGQREYGWQFTATDIDKVSVQVAEQICQSNKGLAKNIKCRWQKHSDNTFDGIIKPGEVYDLTLCNPPFHASLEEASQGTARKWSNLNKNKPGKKSQSRSQSQLPSQPLNFGGQKAELWCPGGEIKFVRSMIRESKHYQQQVLWFTTLVSKRDNLSPIKLALKKAGAVQIKVVKMAQGQKISRFVAWSFLTPAQQHDWCSARFGN